MRTKFKLTATLFALLLTLASCKKEPESKYTPLNGTEAMPAIDSSSTATPSFNDDLHTVKVNEILKTQRYLYLNVSEKGAVEPFWIATRIMDITVGETYFYKGGLLKTNFESKEFNKVFDKIYLVSSNLVLANHATNPDFQNTAANVQADVNPTKTTQKQVAVKGSIKIAELVKNAKKYEGKTVQISGTCTKLNASIMGKNWIHLADGSKDSYDLVVTSTELVNEGDFVTIKAVVTLNKDFGAGYKYDLILENGTLVH